MMTHHRSCILQTPHTHTRSTFHVSWVSSENHEAYHGTRAAGLSVLSSKAIMKASIACGIFFAGCAGTMQPTPKTTRASHAGASVAPLSPACASAREARARATELDGGGHDSLALAKLDEANAACPAERTSSAALESTMLANVGLCAKARAIAEMTDTARAACAVIEAPSKGTETSMRAKMREAYAAERAKDWARAKSLYEDAWVEQHPNTRALEDAARVAALGGDAAASRRIRDRALAEAESSEHAIAELTLRVRVTGGSPSLTGTTLTLGENGKVVTRDTATGELRVLLDGRGAGTTISPYGTLAISAVSDGAPTTTLSVYDVLTGALLFRVPNGVAYAASPDDKFLAVRDEQKNLGADVEGHIYDLATGHVTKTLSGVWGSRPAPFRFSPDDGHVLAFDDAGFFRSFDVEKNSYAASSATGRFASSFGVGAVSPDGHAFAYLEDLSDGATVHARDMVANKDFAQWKGQFHSVIALGITNDGKTLATGSSSSLRLWDVAQKKQIGRRSPQGMQTDDPKQWAFSDDGATMVLAGRGLATAWDVATDTDKPLATDQSIKKLLRVVSAPDDGLAFILEDEVRIVPASGEPRTICKGMKPAYFDIIGPTNVAFSPTNKSFACVMSDGWVHVFDTSSWAERAVIKKGPAASKERPVDLTFADEATLRVVSNTAIVTYDATTGAQSKRVELRHPSLGLAPRHARFDDGSIAVRLWNGSAAIFGADGAYVRDVKLAPSAPIEAPDDFSSNGKTYAVAGGKILHVIDLASGDARVVELASAAKSVSVSADGQSIFVAGADGTVSSVVGTNVTKLANENGTRVFVAGKSLLVGRGTDTLDLVTQSAPLTLEIVADGFVVRDASGAFETRGKPELECVVGKIFLSRETCADRARDCPMASWIHAAR